MKNKTAREIELKLRKSGFNENAIEQILDIVCYTYIFQYDDGSTTSLQYCSDEEAVDNFYKEMDWLNNSCIEQDNYPKFLLRKINDKEYQLITNR